LKGPKNHLLFEMYEGQQKRLQAVVDEIMEIQELSEVFFSFFCSLHSVLFICEFFFLGGGFLSMSCSNVF
jgi:hypothetical protein